MRTFLFPAIFSLIFFFLSASEGVSVLSNGLRVLTVTGGSGALRYDEWRPSGAEVAISEAMATNAIFRSAAKKPKPDSKPPPVHADYIDLGRNISDGNTEFGVMATGVNAVVELVVVVDKEFGDIFGHDRQRILDYLTVYLWDLNMRYKTLPSNSISFRLNGLVIIGNTAGQPFIEEARAEDGRAEFGRILDKYSLWVYQQMGSWPAFDLAPLITNTALEWGGGLAYMNAACWIDTNGGRHLGTGVWNDNGAWNSLTVGAHELGHNLGAPHDDDSEYPGGCSDRGYIMAGATEELRWYFSSCSDRTIGSFVSSSAASCLQRQDGNPIVDPTFASPAAPTMDEQCRRHAGPTAVIEDGDKGNCKYMRCLVPFQDGGGWWVHHIAAVDNTQCTPAGGAEDSGRCFRGNCRQLGNIFRNVGTDLCMRASNTREYMAPLEMFSCPSANGVATPLDLFVVLHTNPSIGYTLESPYYYNKGTESGDACAWTGNAEGDTIWTDRCGDHSNDWHGWEFRDVGNGEFLLVHKVTGRCAKPTARAEGAAIGTYGNCDAGNSEMRWVRWI